jgi:hypothetical protein
MSDKYDGSKIFLIGISVAIFIGTFAVGSQFLQPSLAENLIEQGPTCRF